ncbi:MAG: hypothetical protein HY812_21550 [Planctomycetes bacterium]|nr:hypothetical protein [Planctomycetota bacterium]
MSPIGKIFVVLNFVFSLVILGVLGGILSKSEEYKQKYEGEKQKFSDEQTKWDEERSNLNSEIQSHKNDKAMMGERINNLTALAESEKREKDSLKTDNEQLRGDISQLQADYQKFTASLNELHAHNQQLITKDEELMNERTAAVDARRAAQEEQARLESQVANLTATIEQLKAQIDELEGVAGDLSSQIEAAVQAGFDIASVRAAPQIDAVVQKVNNELSLVVLSVGADDGVKRGTAFEVFKDGQYKGKVVVDDVFPDNCSARIVRGQGQISENDKATTRL